MNNKMGQEFMSALSEAVDDANEKTQLRTTRLKKSLDIENLQFHKSLDRERRTC